MKRLSILIAAIAATITLFAEPPASKEPSDAYYNLVGDADSAIARGQWAKAEEALLSAMRLEPSNPGNIMLMSNLGIVQYNSGKDSLALVTLTQAHDIAPRSVTILGNRARVLMAMGRFEEARADYSAIVEADSTMSDARFHRALLDLKAGHTATARADIDWLKRTSPDDINTNLAEAALASAEGDFAASVIAYTKVLNIDKQPEYYAERAFGYLMTDRPGDAAEDIAAGLELDPTDAQLYLYRAMLNRARFRPEDARADAREALRLGADPREVEPLLR